MGAAINDGQTVASPFAVLQNLQDLFTVIELSDHTQVGCSNALTKLYGIALLIGAIEVQFNAIFTVTAVKDNIGAYTFRLDQIVAGATFYRSEGLIRVMRHLTVSGGDSIVTFTAFNHGITEALYG